MTGVRLQLRSECALKKQSIQILPEPDAGHLTRFLWNYNFIGTIQILRQRSVGGVRKKNIFWWFSVHTIYADVGGWVGLKKAQKCRRNISMVPNQNQQVDDAQVHMAPEVDLWVESWAPLMVLKLLAWLVDVHNGFR